MPEPGRETERLEESLWPGAFRRGRIDVCSMGSWRKLRLVEQMESSDKCRHKTGPHGAKQKTSKLRATISTALSVLCPELLAVNVHHMIGMIHKIGNVTLHCFTQNIAVQ